jgi:hypothetical protein
MVATSYMRIEESVDACLEALTTALEAIPTQIIECASISAGTSPTAMLDRSAFIKACESLKPAVVFIHREYSLLEEQLVDMVSEITDIQTQRDTLQQEFLANEAELMARARRTCPEYSHLQCFFTSGTSVVAMACEVGDYQDFTEALDRFEQAVDEAEEIASSLDQARLNSEMRRISEAVSMDQGFISLRGKRKRAMYVLKHYRQEIPECSYMERPDQGSDPIDRNVVMVARKAADILEFGV